MTTHVDTYHLTHPSTLPHQYTPPGLSTHDVSIFASSSAAFLGFANRHVRSFAPCSECPNMFCPHRFLFLVLLESPASSAENPMPKKRSVGDAYTSSWWTKGSSFLRRAAAWRVCRNLASLACEAETWATARDELLAWSSYIRSYIVICMCVYVCM